MSYFKCPNLNNRVFLEIEEALGGKAAWEALKVINEAYRQKEIDEIDVVLISNWADVKRDRAEKLLPFVKKIFQETKKIWRKSNKNVQKSIGNVQKSSENLPDFTTSNPDGSTRVRARKTETKTNTETKTETITPLPPSGVSQKNGTRIPENWKPTQEQIEWAKNKRPDLDIPTQAENFYDYWRAKPGADGRKLCWDATWRTWIRNSKQVNQQPKSIGSQISASAIKLAHERTGGSGKL